MADGNIKRGGGVFDTVTTVKESDLELKKENENPVQGNEQQNQKEEFLTPHQIQARQRADMEERSREAAKKSPEELAAENISSAMGGPKEDIDKEIDELDSISNEDIALAEELIFKGYAEYDIKISAGKDNFIRICSSTADDVDLINDMMFEYMKNYEDGEGNVNLSTNKIAGTKQMFQLALSYIGQNGKDISEKDPVCRLSTIKNAMRRLSEIEYEGDMKTYKELLAEIKTAVRKRAILVRKMSTPMIDLISSEKQNFDEKMFKIIKSKNLLPKS